MLVEPADEVVDGLWHVRRPVVELDVVPGLDPLQLLSGDRSHVLELAAPVPTLAGFAQVAGVRREAVFAEELAIGVRDV
jgi:hypothetical protein